MEIDPYTGAAGAWTCGSSKSPLWTEDAARALTYVPTGLLIAGFSSAPPDADAIRRGDGRLEERADDPEVLVLWADIFGAQAGDIQSFRIAGPGGSVIMDDESVLDANNVSWFAFGGRRRPPQGWTPGVYTGTFTLSRDGEMIISESVEVEIKR